MSGSGRLRLFFATDLHGSTICFKKLVNAARHYSADVLVCGGDLAGKMVVPLVRQADGTWRAHHLQQERLLGDGDLLEFEVEIADMGYYPYRTDPAEMAELEARPELVDEIFRQHIVGRLQEWLAYAERLLGGTPVRIYAAPGNDDDFYVDDALAGSTVVLNGEGRVVDLPGGYQMISSGWSTPTPWHTHRECGEEELRAKLEAMVAGLANPDLTIFNLHVPPLDSTLDTCPALDATLKPITDAGRQIMTLAGSRAVRDAIECYRPPLGLHGHVHEGRGYVRIGPTLCINPGSSYSEGILQGALVTFDGGRVKSYQLTAG
jgi:Icc-related predicted phosphoesterase